MDVTWFKTNCLNEHSHLLSDMITLQDQTFCQVRITCSMKAELSMPQNVHLHACKACNIIVYSIM